MPVLYAYLDIAVGRNIWSQHIQTAAYEKQAKEQQRYESCKYTKDYLGKATAVFNQQIQSYRPKYKEHQNAKPGLLIKLLIIIFGKIITPSVFIASTLKANAAVRAKISIRAYVPAAIFTIHLFT